jgi:hypothetical protein
LEFWPFWTSAYALVWRAMGDFKPTDAILCG